MSRTYFVSIAAAIVVVMALLGMPVQGADEGRPAAEDSFFLLHPPATPVEKALANPVNFDFQDTPLEDAAKAIAKSSGIEITLDIAALASAKIDPKLPVTFDGPRMPLRAALYHLLDRSDLIYRVTGENSLTITAETPTEKSLVVKTYDVKDLAENTSSDGKPVAKPFDWLVDAITATVGPTTWEDAGGNATIAVVGDKLVVKQTPEEQDVLADFLMLVRIARDHPEKIRNGYPRIAGASVDLAKALLTPHDFEFKATPLKDVVKSLADFDVPVVFDDKALKEANISRKLPITLSAKQISADAFLEVLGRQIGACCLTDGDTMLLTAGECDMRARPIFYPVGDIVDRMKLTAPGKDPYQQLSGVITKTVTPYSWADSGGSGTVVPLPVVKTLLIVQNSEGQKVCGKLIAALRAAGAPVPAEHAKQQDGAISAAEQALDKEVTLKYANVPLADVAKSIGDMTGVNVLLDLQALQEAGVDGATKVDFEAPQLPLRTALNFLLQQMDLAYEPTDDNIIWVTTESRAKNTTTVKVYDMQDLAAPKSTLRRGEGDFDWLIDVITSCVAPTAWSAAGGSGSIASFGNALVVHQTPDIQEQVAALLVALRTARDHPEENRNGVPAVDIKVSSEDAKAAQGLQARHDFQFQATPLGEVAKQVSKLGVPVMLDIKALTEASMDATTPITFSAKNISIARMFASVLAPLDLQCIVDHGVALTTTKAIAKEKDINVVYPVGDLIDAAKSDAGAADPYGKLIKAITANVMATSWAKTDGSANIASAPPVKAIVVSQIPDGQRQCAALLAKLRAVPPVKSSPDGSRGQSRSNKTNQTPLTGK